MFADVKRVLFSPVSFFDELADTPRGLNQPLLLLLVLLIVPAIMNFVILFALPFFLGFNPLAIKIMMKFGLRDAQLATATAVAGFVLWVVGTFVVAGIAWLYLRLWGAKGSYVTVFSLLVYSAVPQILLGWLPIGSNWVQLWSLVLLVLGTKSMYRISARKAVLAWVLPSIVIFSGVTIFGVVVALVRGALL